MSFSGSGHGKTERTHKNGTDVWKYEKGRDAFFGNVYFGK